MVMKVKDPLGSADCFLIAIKVLLTDKSVGQKLPVYEFAFCFYSIMWEMELEDARNRKDLILKHTVKGLGPRYAPTVNKIGSKEGLEDAIRLMSATHHACCLIPKHEQSDIFFLIKAHSMFAAKTTGVQHAGDLMVQHLLVIGLSVGGSPSSFMSFGEIGKTKFRKGLQKSFNPFKENDEHASAAESSTILKALSFYT
eukprot:921584-Ditylum_brightwellii.AAC.1